MEHRKHPTFKRRMNLLAAICPIAAMLMCNLFGWFGPRLLPEWLQLAAVAILLFGSAGYAIWAGKHVECPQCGSRCEPYAAERYKGRKVLCRPCDIIWDLGLRYARRG